jgi:MFS family permease
MTEMTNNAATDRPGHAPSERATGLRGISAEQWKSGTAAWLGWMFDGLDMHLYTLVATPFVAELLHVSQKDRSVGYYSSWIQAAFLLGWALGGGFFGRVGDRLGRAHALMLTILTYAVFTGLSFFAHTWWQLLICRFLAALGIGGEWAVGASLLAETWPSRWRPWIAAVLQSAVNVGVIFAMLAGQLLKNAPPRYVFLVGIIPALMVVWIRRAVPEPREWSEAKLSAAQQTPRLIDLFKGEVRRTTVLTVLVCACSLTAHWAFMFWYLQHLRNLPDLADWTEPQKTSLVSNVMICVMAASIVGNFLAGWLAKRLGYRRSISFLYLAYFAMMFYTYAVPRGYLSLSICVSVLSVASGLFGLFTMYLPPLFPTLLRTTGAGFCYNIGRVVAAGGTLFFGVFSVFSQSGDYRYALLAAACLFLPSAGIVLLLPEPVSQQAGKRPRMDTDYHG